jgi:hypothetical protein
MATASAPRNRHLFFFTHRPGSSPAAVAPPRAAVRALVRALVRARILALALALPSGLAACGFGDDSPLPGGPDAPLGDAPPDDGPPVDTNPPPAMAKVLEVRPMPPTPIPDDDEITGATIAFTVTGVTVNTGLDVQVDITHSYRGDLRIELLRDTALVSLLKAADIEDNEDNVVTTFSVSPADLGTPLNGSYAVKITDSAPRDTGVINLVKLTFKVN